MAKLIDPKEYRGKKFGQLVVKEIYLKQETKDKRRSRARCECSCGKEHHTSLPNLTKGKVKSCGCSKRKAALDQIGRSYNLLTIKDVYSKRPASNPQ